MKHLVRVGSCLMMAAVCFVAGTWPATAAWTVPTGSGTAQSAAMTLVAPALGTRSCTAGTSNSTRTLTFPFGPLSPSAGTIEATRTWTQGSNLRSVTKTTEYAGGTGEVQDTIDKNTTYNYSVRILLGTGASPWRGPASTFTVTCS